MNPYSTYEPSGIDWIGDIPSHWEAKKLKYLVSGRLEYGANEAAELDDENLPRYIRITDFGDDGNLRHSTFKSLPYEVAQDYLLEEGDVLFARSGATVGKTFQFKNYKGDACFAGYLIRARPNEQLVSDFLYNYTKSGIYENWKNSIFNQATIQNIGADKYNLLFVPLPPLSEQAAIARFLDEKTTQLDTLIDRKRRLIDLLREEKTALINEAVTKGINPDVPMKDSGIEWLGEIPAHWEVKKLKFIAETISKGTTPSTEGREILPEGEVRFIKAENIQEGRLCKEPAFFIDEATNEVIKRSKLRDRDILIVIAGATIGKIAIMESDFLPANTNQAVCFIRPKQEEVERFIWYWL